MNIEIRAVHIKLAENDCDKVRRILMNCLNDNSLSFTLPSQNILHNSCLLIAPHEFTQNEQKAILGKTPWTWIHLTSAGFDFFPIESVPDTAIVTRTYNGYAAPLAEYIVRSMLNHAKDIGKIGIRGARIGVIGFGGVGQRLVKILQHLEAEIIVMRKMPIEINGIRTTTNVEDMLDVSQLAVAIPLNRETIGILNSRFFYKCRPGMHIINVSRGELIDQEALLYGVRMKNVHATLDVTVPEPLPEYHELRKQSNVHITNHSAWDSGDNKFLYLNDFIKIYSLLKIGRRPPGIIKDSATISSAPWKV